MTDNNYDDDDWYYDSSTDSPLSQDEVNRLLEDVKEISNKNEDKKMDNNNTPKKITIKSQLKLLLGRKVIMLIFCAILGFIGKLYYDVDPWFIVGLYGAFVGGNGIERWTQRNNNMD